MIRRVLFRGAAWGVITYFGAIQALDAERRKPNSCISSDVKLHGLSAGALVLLLHVLGWTEKEMCDIYQEYFCISRTNMFTSEGFDITKINIQLLQRILNANPTAYIKMNEANSRIGVTTEHGFRFVKNFKSNLDLANALMCSFHIPCLSNYDANIDGQKALDGGVGFNASVFIESNRNESLIIGASNHESHINFDVSTVFLLVPPPQFLHNHYIAVGYNITMKNLANRLFNDDNVVEKKWSDASNSIWWHIQKYRHPNICFEDLKKTIK